MGKLKLFVLLIVLIGLGFFTYQLVNQKKSSLSKEALSDFAVKDTASIDRIKISSNAVVDMVDFVKTDGEWRFADGGCMQIHMINAFLETIKYISIKSPVPKGTIETVNKQTLAQHKKVEIFQNGKLTKTWFIGSATSDHYGTYMILKNEGIGISPEPFITFQPSIYGNLSDQFSVHKKDYECSGIFTYDDLLLIKEIDVINHENTKQNFTILSLDSKGFELLNNGEKVPNFDTVKVRDYITGYAKMHYNIKEPIMPSEMRDSIMNSPPHYTISITDKDGNKNTLITHLKGADHNDYDYDGNLIPIDRDRLYGVMNNGTFVLLQYFVFDKAFKTLENFIKKISMAVYLDNAATTPMANEVIDEMTEIMKTEFGNPSSVHSFGRNAKAIIENARRKVAQTINCLPKELIFTSGGTEADNMAILCSVIDLDVKHIITSKIEHHAVGYACEASIKKHKVKVSYVNMDTKGQIDLEHLTDLLASSSEKTLVTLMHANNEIGTLIPIKQIGQICRKHNAYFHSDTVQTMGHYNMDLKNLEIDFVTCSAHKFHGPKGIGFLYANKSLQIKPFIEGGSQERGLRAGTENISGIVGLTKALELACHDPESHQDYVQGIKSYMIDSLRTNIPGVQFHGDITPENSLYTVLNVCFPPFSKQDMLLFMLDLEGVACSGGSACSSGASVGSHVLRGINADASRSNVRFSFSRYTQKQDIEFAVEKIKKIMQS